MKSGQMRDSSVWQERKLQGSNSAWNWAVTDFFLYDFFLKWNKNKPMKIILGQINLIWPEAKCQIWFTANVDIQSEMLCIRVPRGSTRNMVHAGGICRVAFIFPTAHQLHLAGCSSLQSQRNIFYLLPKSNHLSIAPTWPKFAGSPKSRWSLS